MGVSIVFDRGLTLYKVYDDGLFDDFLDRIAVIYQSLYGHGYPPYFNKTNSFFFTLKLINLSIPNDILSSVS
jgi:hypothetical protein